MDDPIISEEENDHVEKNSDSSHSDSELKNDWNIDAEFEEKFTKKLIEDDK